MTPQQHARAKDVFLSACARPPEERAAYLDKECAADAELRAHVDKLLLHHSGAPLETRPAESAAAPARADERDDSTDGQFAPGTIVLNRYQVVSLLGRGGMGEVYLANDTVLNQRVALKFLPPRFAGDPVWVERLLREVRTARRVTNPSVCRVFDIEIGQEGPAFITMEYVDGESLSSLIRRIGRLPTAKALDIARQICTGLCAAHGVGLLHRDLKPSNIMVDGGGAVRIMDFGLAAPRDQISATEIRAGTPAYMAPELFAGTDVSVQSDLYALGLVLYELFAGRPAFDGQSYTELARQHQRASPPPLAEFVPYIPPAVEHAIRHCLEKDPRNRPESALAVAAELPGTNPLAIAAAAGVTATARQVASAAAGRVLSLSRGLALLVGLCVLLALVAILGQNSGVWPDLQHSKPTPVLLERARSLCHQLAPSSQPVAEAWRFTFRSSEELFANAEALGDSTDHPDGAPNRAPPCQLATGEPVAYAFWYRKANRTLTPRGALNITFGGARTTLNDPPRDAPGMTTCVLDRSGRLVAFQTVPADSAQAAVATHANWTELLSAAELPPEPQPADNAPRTAPWYADQRRAWTVPRGEKSSELRAEAAARDGRAVHFALLERDHEESAFSDYVGAAWRIAFSIRMRVILLALALAGMIPLAWRNLRQGRGDVRGAARLAIFVACVRMTVWGLGGSHTAILSDELVLLLFALLGALAEAALVWIGYVAIEPHVRKHWPQTIISWTRMLSGEFRDALVCRDVLLGTLIGAAGALLVVLDRRIAGWVGLTPLDPLRLLDMLDPLVGTRLGIASGLHALLIGLYMSLTVVVLLVLACVLVRRPMIAALITGLFLVPVYIVQLSHPAVSWGPLLVFLAILIGAAMRLGLVAIVVGNLVMRLLVTFPLSFDSAGWALDGTIAAVLVILGLALFAILAVRRTPDSALSPAV